MECKLTKTGGFKIGFPRPLEHFCSSLLESNELSIGARMRVSSEMVSFVFYCSIRLLILNHRCETRTKTFNLKVVISRDCGGTFDHTRDGSEVKHVADWHTMGMKRTV